MIPQFVEQPQISPTSPYRVMFSDVMVIEVLFEKDFETLSGA